MPCADLHCPQKSFAAAQRPGAEKRVIKMAISNQLWFDRITAVVITLTFARLVHEDEMLAGEFAHDLKTQLCDAQTESKVLPVERSQ